MDRWRLWVFAAVLEDAPGSLLTLVSAFANRAVSLLSVLGCGASITGEGLVLVSFRCSERRRRELERVVRRLAVVRSVEAVEVEEPERGRVVLMEVTREGLSAPEGLRLVRLTERWLLAGGPEPVLRPMLRGAIDAGIVARHAEVML